MSTGGYDPNKDPQNPGGDPYPSQGGSQGGDYPPPSGYPPPPSGGNYPPPGSYPPPGNYPPPPGNYPPPGGSYPPPGSNYPPPGGYPPPPGGNYPPPPGGYGPGGSGGGFGPTQLSVGDAISFGWRKFSANPGVWIVMVVIAFLIQALINGIFNGFDFTVQENDDFTSAFSAAGLIGSVVSAIVGYLIEAAFVRGALSEVDGRKPAFGTFVQIAPVGAVILTGLLVGLGTSVGLVLCIVPGLVFAFFAWWAMPFVIDRNQDAITAIKSSYHAIKSNAGTLFLLALALVGLNILGALLCGLGLLVSIPVTIIASTYAYRITTGGPVVA